MKRSEFKTYEKEKIQNKGRKKINVKAKKIHLHKLKDKLVHKEVLGGHKRSH